MGLPVVCLYWILIWAYIYNIYQHQVQQQIATLSLPKGRGYNFTEGKYHSYSRKQLINLRPSSNTRLLNTDQVTNIQVYCLK